MPSVLKFHVSSGLQVLDLPFVRDHSPLSLNPGPLCLVHSIYSSSLAILAPTRTHEPSIWSPFYFCSPSHRLSLPVQWPVITVTSLGAPCLFSFMSYSFCFTTALVSYSSPPLDSRTACWRISLALGPSCSNGHTDLVCFTAF